MPAASFDTSGGVTGRGSVARDGTRLLQRPSEDVPATVNTPGDPGYTIPSDGPDRRINYVYILPGSVAPLPTIDACERVFTVPMGGVYASDHIGVRCTFTP